jgi:drug/metabolite transporter (DMT)-like permease
VTVLRGGLAARNPHAFGMAVTLAGVLVFVPDALVLRLIGADMMTVAVWRGLQAALVFLVGVALLAPAALRNWRDSLRGVALLVAALEGAAMVLFCAAIGATSVANTLLILATAPFIAAVMSLVFLGERIDRATLLAIAAAFSGVAILASGSLGAGSIRGDLLALANAVCMAGFYVALRKAGQRNMFPAIALGYLAGSLLALPFASMEALVPAQIGWLVLSGAVILPGAIALLSLGPRYLTAPEVSMLTLLEVILAPLLVWALLGEDPGTRSLIGGGVIVLAILCHAMWRLRSARNRVVVA